MTSCYYTSFYLRDFLFVFFFFQAEDGIRDYKVTGVQTCALPISAGGRAAGLGVGAAGCRQLQRAVLRLSGRADGGTRGRGAAPVPRSRLLTREIGRARVGKECRSRWSPYH